MKKKCYGKCSEESQWCEAEDIVRVAVYGRGTPQSTPWVFNYCRNAIKTDREAGFTVEIIGEWFKAEDK